MKIKLNARIVTRDVTSSSNMEGQLIEIPLRTFLNSDCQYLAYCQNQKYCRHLSTEVSHKLLDEATRLPLMSCPE